MSNPYFQFKQFTVMHDRCAMKVTTDGCLFGAWCAEEIKTAHQKLSSALDIGTGTGLLSLMVAQKNNIAIAAVEIDKEAAVQARENIATSPWKENIQVIHNNILNVPVIFYDYIISNPPFYQNEIASQQSKKNIAHHGEGLLLTDLFSTITQRLSDDGVFFLLLPSKRNTEIEKLLGKNNLVLLKKVWIRQTEKHTPFRLMIKGTKGFKKVVEESEIIIQNQHKEYTPEFVRLLKDYYLYL